jgi:hypothetical protein
LSEKFSQKYEVTLCLAVESLVGLTAFRGFNPIDLETRILNEWNVSKFPVFPKVISLDDFKATADSVNLPHQFIKDELIIIRGKVETQILDCLQPGNLPGILLQGRYKVGKSTCATRVTIGNITDF